MKFERLGGKNFKYDPVIFPLYDGYADGADNTEIYEEGGTSMWKRLLPLALAMAVVGLLGVWAFLRFSLGGGQSGEAPATAQSVEEPIVACDLQGRQLYTEAVAPAARPAADAAKPIRSQA